MASTAGSRSTRARPSKPPLSLDAIVDAGLAITREEGIDAITMRRVAAQLDTGPASLYVYVRNREELMRAMLDRVTGEIATEPVDPKRWREQVHRLVGDWLRALVSYPGLASVTIAEPPTSPKVLQGAEYLISVLLAGGITPQDAAWSCDVLPLIVTATAMETYIHEVRAHEEAETVQRLMTAFETLPAEQFPNTTRYVAELTGGSGDERFRFAVDVFLDGLVARAQRA